MNRSFEYAKELNDYLLNLDVIKEYQKYEDLINNNEEIKDLENKMKAYQKKIVNQKAKRDCSVDETIKKYQQFKGEFENHPLVVNYLYLKDEVNNLLQMINTYINRELLK